MISSIRRVRPIDYSILLDPQPAGPPIGRYAGKEFSEFVRDAFGRLFVFAGIAPRRANGGFDDDALRPGEFIVLPGLIYRHSGTGSRSPIALTEVALTPARGVARAPDDRAPSE